MLDRINSLFRSLNFKILIFAGVLCLMLLMLIVKAAMIRGKRRERLTDINRQISPVKRDGYKISWKDAFPELAARTPMPGAAEQASAQQDTDETDKGTDGGAEIDQPELNKLIYTFLDYRLEERRELEKELFEYFTKLTRNCEKYEMNNEGGKAAGLFEGYFERVGAIGYPYLFEKTAARDDFVSHLSSEWPRLPFLSQWACIRMMGVVVGEEVRKPLLIAIGQGIYEDEASISLLRTGDARAVPVLVDYMSRRRLKKERYNEIVTVIRELADPVIISTLIEYMGSPDASIRFVALKLMNSVAPPALNPPRGNYPDDPDLKQQWETWWAKAGASYRSRAIDVPRITKLTIITGFNLLASEGHLSRSYFKEISGEIEECCRKLRSRQLGVHREGELELYGLCRQIVQDYESGDENVKNVVAQYMLALAEEVERVCLLQVFPVSQERNNFLSWVTDVFQRKEEKPVLVFMIRVAGVVGDGGAAASLQRFQESFDMDLKNAAIVSMGKLGAPEAADGLHEMLEDKDIFPAEGREAIVGLERISSKKAIGYLVLTMRGAAPVIAYESYLALRRIRGKWTEALSLDEFEQARKPLTEDYMTWLRRGRTEEEPQQ